MSPLEPDHLLYAIGDLHGRADLLLRAIEKILAEAHQSPPEVVFLGDYIDRGGEARATLAALVEVARLREIRPIFLKGNHEAMLLNFLADPVAEARWLRVGGLETLLSFGIGAYETTSEPELARIADELRPAIAPFLSFIEGLKPYHLSGNLLCVHAGADPARAPQRQRPETLLWGHPEFEKIPRQDGLWVVHGHRVIDAPRVERGRIAIDTGAYLSGILTMLKADPGAEPEFVSLTLAG
ncbi:MAG: metallophosphoesterase [Pikeienuella sp.]